MARLILFCEWSMLLIFTICCADPSNGYPPNVFDKDDSLLTSLQTFNKQSCSTHDYVQSHSSSQLNLAEKKASYLGDKGIELSQIQSSNGFIFFTDTHEQANDQNTARIINLALNNTRIDKVIWGGDAIGAYGTKNDLDKQWNSQKKIFSSLKTGANTYCVRGNHDFTIKNSAKDTTGYTYTQKESFNMIQEVMSTNVVRNEDDTASLYYYFDDISNKVRYIIIEAFSNSSDGNVAWKVSTRVQKKQIDWIANTAISTTPQGYNIIVVLHAPITDTTGPGWKSFRNVLNIVNAASEKKTCVIDKENYDFSTLKNVNMLMVVSGHDHHDMQTYQHGVLHVTTASDAHYKDFTRDPFTIETSRGKGYLQHAVDVFSIDLEQRIIQTIRIGVGGNRKFHLDPVEIDADSSFGLSISLKGNVKWYSYNASGNYYKDGKWTLNNDVISVSENGCVTGKSAGEAVLMVQDELGNREIFNVKVH